MEAANMDCDTYELHIEQRAHGALAAPEQAALAAHLEQCARCRDFAALVRRIESKLVERVRAELTRVDWPRLDREVTIQAFVVRWVLVGLGGFPLVALPWVVWQNPHRPEAYLPFGLFGVVIAALCWGMRSRWLRQWERQSQEDLVPFYRRWLDQRIKDSGQSATMCVVTSAAIPAIIWFGERPDTLFLQVVLGAAPLVLLSSAVYLIVVLRPRLRRELKALE
jgi:hypothetical protein